VGLIGQRKKEYGLCLGLGTKERIINTAFYIIDEEIKAHTGEVVCWGQ
jgi:hypothetical protein